MRRRLSQSTKPSWEMSMRRQRNPVNHIYKLIDWQRWLFSSCTPLNLKFYDKLKESSNPLIDLLINWLIDLLIDWLIAGLMDWWIDWWKDGLVDWWIDWLIDGLMDWWIDAWIGGLIDGWIGGLIDWWMDWLSDTC